jgi:hypothetical protein
MGRLLVQRDAGVCINLSHSKFVAAARFAYEGTRRGSDGRAIAIAHRHERLQPRLGTTAHRRSGRREPGYRKGDEAGANEIRSSRGIGLAGLLPRDRSKRPRAQHGDEDLARPPRNRAFEDAVEL